MIERTTSTSAEPLVLRDGPTSLGSWGLAIASALESRGVDARALLAEVGLTLEALAEPRRRHALELTTRLWRSSVTATGDRACGIEVARHTDHRVRGTVHVAGQRRLVETFLVEVLSIMARRLSSALDVAALASALAGAARRS